MTPHDQVKKLHKKLSPKHKPVMFARISTSSLLTSRAAATATAAPVPAFRFAQRALLTTNILQQRESAAEGQFIHEHEMEVIQKLQNEVRKKELEHLSAKAALDACVNATLKSEAEIEIESRRREMAAAMNA
ncbi:hypothetical protein HDU98_000781 [Podochytrium sp. JEL0797]|nr:hypothetical protein HDU98_000781 [Podochytrium sp. JEL0797]